MTELQIRVDESAAVDALWQLLINKTHGVADQPDIGAAKVQIKDRDPIRFWYAPELGSWEIEQLDMAPIAAQMR